MLNAVLKNEILGLTLTIIGVLANNYVYLHDIVLNKHGDGIIMLGWKSGVGIAVTLVVVAIGLVILMRSRAREAAE